MGIFDWLFGKKKVTTKRDVDVVTIPMSEYSEFYNRLADSLRVADPYILFSKHRAYCAVCGVEFTREALQILNLFGPKGILRGTSTIMGEGVNRERIKQEIDIKAGKCPNCGHFEMKIVVDFREDKESNIPELVTDADKELRRIEIKEYTKVHHLNKIEDVDAKEALEVLLSELEAKSSATQKYFYNNIAAIKNGNKWLHIKVQPASFLLVIYGTFNADDLKAFQKVSASARLESYGINLKIEKPSQIEELLKLIL